LSVIRISGPRAQDALIFLTERKAFERGGSAREPALPEPRHMVVRSVWDPLSGELIDRGLAVWFEAPLTETGETMVELHLHGGRAVVNGALDAIAKLGFCRLAEPGEFTRRAFENRKLDLTAAEAIADLVAAETDQQRRQAIEQMGGALRRLYEDWRTLGLRVLAHLEAAIDFPDEDLPAGIADEVSSGITRLRGEIAGHLEDRRGERLRQGLSIAIIGPPNAGKSSLLNLLARRDAAIVSETAGTTRDVIEVHLDLGGWPVVLADTAGLAPVGGRDRAGGRAPCPGARRGCRSSPAGARRHHRLAGGDAGADRSGRTLEPRTRHRGGEQGRSQAGRCGGRDAAVGRLRRGPAEVLERITRSVAHLMEQGAGAAAAHPGAPSRGAGRGRAGAGPRAAGKRSGARCRGRAARHAGDRPHHRHGADRRAARRHFQGLLHRQVRGTRLPVLTFHPP
jgi:hypothetical protein